MVAQSRDTDRDIARTLRLSITGQCNLSCFYCKPLGKAAELFESKNLIQPSDVTKIVRIVGELGVNRVHIGGGEPLLRKDAANFVKSAMAHKNINEVRLLTNGTYLKAHADELRKNGLRKVDIDFDTLNFKKYQALTKRDDLFRVLDGIEKVEKLNYPDIRLNIHLFHGVNDDELIDFARITKDRKLLLRFIEYCPVNSAGDPMAERPKLTVLAAKRMIDNFQKLHPAHDLESDVPVPTYRFVDGIGRIAFLSEMEVSAEKSIPTVVFNAEGALYNEAAPNRPVAVLEELRRDAKQDHLKRAIEKVMLLHQEVRAKAVRKAPAAVVMARSKSAKQYQANARR